jgi:peptide/nickel transport system ATP-binding protein
MHKSPLLNDDGSFLSAKRLTRRLLLPRYAFWRASERKLVMNNISLSLRPSERVGLVGMSGSGKTTLLRALLAIDRPDAGTITCKRRDVKPGSVASLRWYRQAVQYIPQDPASSLDPRMTASALVAEPLIRLHVNCDPRERVQDALEQVGLGRQFLERRPSELSGGQAQRVAIARAIATRPEFILADEPLSGLDLPVRRQVVAVLEELCATTGMGLMIVSHDLSVVAKLCQRTLVMDEGEIVEDRPTADLLSDPHHGRTSELINAIVPLPALSPPRRLEEGVGSRQ